MIPLETQTKPGETANAIIDDQVNRQAEERKEAAVRLIEAYAKAMVIQNLLNRQEIASESWT